MLKRTDLTALDREIRLARLAVGALAFVTVLAYWIWFYVLQARSVSNDTDAWGQFGDFVGGLLNPVVAFAAFHWLTRSVRIQKEELEETRIALDKAADAQSAQAESSFRQVRLAALTALAQAVTTDIQTLNSEWQHMASQLAGDKHRIGIYTTDGEFSKPHAAEEKMSVLRGKIRERRRESAQLENEIRSLLLASSK